MKKITFILNFLIISSISADYNSSALLLACNNLNQPDISELSILRKDKSSETIYLYLTDSNQKLIVLESGLNEFIQKKIKLPDFVKMQRALVKKNNEWSVQTYYKNKTITRLAECMELGED